MTLTLGLVVGAPDLVIFNFYYQNYSIIINKIAIISNIPNAMFIFERLIKTTKLYDFINLPFRDFSFT